MRALIQLHDGYAGTQTGPNIDDLSPFVTLQDVSVPTPGDGQALVKVHLAAVGGRREGEEKNAMPIVAEVWAALGVA